MNRSLYFLIPAILVVAIFIGYSVLGKQTNETLTIAETTTVYTKHTDGDNHTSADHMISSSTSATHDDTRGVAHTH